MVEVIKQLNMTNIDKCWRATSVGDEGSRTVNKC